MAAIGSTLDAMGVEQYLLAFLFLVSYTLALSDFIGARGRHYAVMGALTAAIAFAARTDPWMHGVLVVVVAVVAIGAFAGIVWGLWAAFGWPHSDGLAAERIEAPTAPSTDGTLSRGAAAAAVLHRPQKLAQAGETQR
jgi:hypothetical protein